MTDRESLEVALAAARIELADMTPYFATETDLAGDEPPTGYLVLVDGELVIGELPERTGEPYDVRPKLEEFKRLLELELANAR